MGVQDSLEISTYGRLLYHSEEKTRERSEATGFLWERAQQARPLSGSLGNIYSHPGGRGEILQLIILLLLYSFLPGCSQAKVKASPVSPVPNRDTRWKAGRALERREGRNGERSALGFVAAWKITESLCRTWSQIGHKESRSLVRNMGRLAGHVYSQLSQRVQINTMSQLICVY